MVEYHLIFSAYVRVRPALSLLLYNVSLEPFRPTALGTDILPHFVVPKTCLTCSARTFACAVLHTHTTPLLRPTHTHTRTPAACYAFTFTSTVRRVCRVWLRATRGIFCPYLVVATAGTRFWFVLVVVAARLVRFVPVPGSQLPPRRYTPFTLPRFAEHYVRHLNCIVRIPPTAPR